MKAYRGRPGLNAALAAVRALQGKSRAEVARDAGIKPEKLAAYEEGRTTPNPVTLERLAKVLGVSIPVLEVLGDLLAAFHALLGAAGQLLGGAWTAGVIRSAVRFARAVHAALSERIEALPAAPPAAMSLSAEEERRHALALWERLQAYTSDQRRAVYMESPRPRSWGLVELLCQQSLDAAPDSASRALELAEEAHFLARLVPVPEPFRWRLEGYAGVHLGNAMRVGGQLPVAGTALDEALGRWQAGAPGDPEGLLDEARVLGLEASLRREQRRLPEALDLLERALAADCSDEVRYLLINKAKTLEEMGRHEEAIASLRQALPRIDAQREPRLLWDMRQNLLVNLCRLGRHAEAAQHLENLREEAIRLGHRLHLVRVGWLQGTIAAGLNRPEEAEVAFEQVRKEFLARGIAYDAALVSLELAVLYLKEGRTAEVQELARQLAPVFHAQGVSRETLASVKLFCEAAEKETITLELAQHVLEDLRRAGS